MRRGASRVRTVPGGGGVSQPRRGREGRTGGGALTRRNPRKGGGGPGRGVGRTPWGWAEDACAGVPGTPHPPTARGRGRWEEGDPGVWLSPRADGAGAAALLDLVRGCREGCGALRAGADRPRRFPAKMRLLACVVLALCAVSHAEEGARLLASKSLLNRYAVEGRDLTLQYNIYNVGSR